MFKKRYRGHKQDFGNQAGRTKTTLAGHMWRLRDNQEDPDISWEVVCHAAPFSPITGVCNLCTSEKWQIIFKPESATLNRRQELFNHCRHKEKLLLVKKVRRLRLNGTWPHLTQGFIQSLWLLCLMFICFCCSVVLKLLMIDVMSWNLKYSLPNATQT